MAGSLLDLFVKIGIDDKEAVSGIENISKKGAGLSKVLKGAGVAVGALSTAAVALGTAFIKGVSETSAYGDEVDKMSQKIGLSTEGYQKWRYVLGQSGGNINNMQMGMKTLASAAYDGSEAFEAIGISLEEAQSLSTEQLFEKTITQLSEMEAGTERTALATDLFGRSATDIMPMLNGGAESIEELKKQAEDYGLILSQDAVNASVKFGDSVDLMQQTLGGMKNRMMSEFLPALTNVTDGLALLFTGDMSGLDDINDGITEFVDKIADAIPQIVEIGGSILQTLATAIMNNMPILVTTAFNLITSLGMFVLENLPLLLQTALTILTTLAMGLAEQAPVLIPAVIETLLTMIDVLVNNIPLLLDAAVQLMLGLTKGIIGAIPVLVTKLPQIITAIVNALVANLPMLINASIQIVVALAQGIIQAIPQLLQAIPQIVQALVKGFSNALSTIANIGLNIVKGIWQGISNGMSWIYGKIRGWVSSVLKYIKSLFGIKSPSTVMANEVGKFIPEGLAVGIDKYSNAAKSAMSDLMNSLMGETFTPTISANVNATGSRLATVSSGTSTPAGGVNIGAINFNQPVSSPVQNATMIKREFQGALYVY